MSGVEEKRVMIALSTRAKEAIKVALAMVIVYAIAMQMGWDKPYWAGFTVVTINVLSAGVSLGRGLARSLSTLVGAVAGLVIMSLFPQERWWLMLCVSLYLGVCTYLLTGKHQSYFWFLAAFTCLIIIGVSSPPEPQSVFQVAVLRTQETALGALVYILVAAFLWPVSSVGLFNGACRKLWTTQTQLYHAYRELMSGKGTAEDTRPLRLKQIQQLAQVGGLLNAAESDSYEVWEVRDRWRQFRRAGADHGLHSLIPAPRKGVLAPVATLFPACRVSAGGARPRSTATAGGREALEISLVPERLARDPRQARGLW